MLVIKYKFIPSYFSQHIYLICWLHTPDQEWESTHICVLIFSTPYLFIIFSFSSPWKHCKLIKSIPLRGMQKTNKKKQKNTQNTTNKEDLISYVLSEHQDAACTSLSKNLSKCLFWALHSIKAKCITTIFISKAQHASCRCEAVWIRAPHAHFVLDTTWEKKTQIKNILVSTIPAVPGARTIS